MLKTKRKILATLVAFTLVMTSIMPNVALALETVEDTQPSTKITETEPAASTKSTKKPETSKPKETTKATEETKATSETTKETSETTKKHVESTTKATEASKEETSTTTTVESSKKTEESKVSESTPKESTETSAETASTTETSETKETTKETTETTKESAPIESSTEETAPSESSKETVPSESTTEETTVPTESSETEVTEPTESTEPSESTEETEPSESSSETSEPEETEFNQSITVDGIKITVTADKGVFPNGAELTAKKVENNKINKEDNVVASMTFDIAIMLNGEEIEPDTTKGQVKVTFFDERFEDKNLDAAIYHTSDDKKTEELKIKNVEGGAEVTTDGFSLYTVEFTYEDMKYTLTGYASAPLKTILEKVGLTGEVTEVKISNEKLVRYENGYIFAVKAFSTKEWMKVTINDITYLITLTDSPDSPEDATAGTDAYAVLYDSGKLVFQKGQDIIGAYGTVVNSWLIPANWDDSSTTNTVELAPWVNNTSITDVIFIDNIKGITNLGSYFKGLTNLTNVANANRIDTSTVANAGSMFYECTSLETVNLDGWDLSSATSLGSFLNGMFSNTSSIKTISMKNWDNLPADCSNVFGRYCYLSGSGITIDVTGWDTSTVTNMSGLFASNAITNIVGYKNFNMSNVTTVSQMFQGAQLATIDCSNWNTSNITTFGSGTFCGSSVNKTLILDNCDLRQANFSGGSFYNETISMKNAKIGNTFAGSSGFGRGAGAAGTLKTIDVTNMDLSGCTSLNTFFASFGNNVTIIGLDTLNTSTVTDFSFLFQSSSINTSIDLSNFTFKSGDNINYMLDGITGVTTIKLPASISNVDFSTAKLAGNWQNTSTNEVIKGTEITSGGTYTRYFNPNIAEVGANAYAVLYSDGTLIFQNTDEAINGHGSIDISWAIDSSNHPWTNSPYNTQVTSVIFDKPLSGRTSAWSMFNGCSNLVTITNLNKLDTSSITDMDSMFYGCSSLTTLDLSNFDTTSSNYFNHMFENCSSLTSIDISSFSNLNNKTTDAIFIGCTNLTSVKFGANWRFSNTNWYSAAIKWKNTSTNNVYTSSKLANSWSSSLAGTYTREAIGDDAYVSFNAYVILYSDGTLVFQKGDTADSTYGTVVQTWTVDESSHPWTNSTYKSQVRKVIFKNKLFGRTSCASMFNGCNNLSSITNFANLDMQSVTSTNSMFWDVVSINTIDFTGMDLSYITDCGWMFGCSSYTDYNLVEILGAQHLINSNNTNTVQTMFQNRTVLTTIEGTETWDLSNVTNTSWMFNNCYKIDGLKTANWNMSNVTSAYCMFNNCSALTELNTTNWDLGEVTDMQYMFEGCSKLETLDTTNWNPSKCTEFGRAFKGTSKLKTVNMSNWTVNNAQGIWRMFWQSGVTEVDISGFNCTSGYADYFISEDYNVVKIVLPSSIEVYSLSNRQSMLSNTGYWLKDGTTIVNYNELTTGGTYEKLLKTITFKKDANTVNDTKFYITYATSVIDIPNELLTLPNNAAGESFAGWFDADDIQYTNIQITKNTPEILYAKFEHEPQTAVYGNDLYQLLYLDSNNNYIIVYQKGNTPSSEYGTFQRSSLVAAKDANYNYTWLDPDYVLQLDYFYDEGSNIPNITNANKVIFRDRLTNLPEAAVKFSSTYVKKYSHLDYIDMSNATSLSFNGKTNVSGCAGMAQWNTSHITSLKYAFNSTNFDNCDIPNLSNWDVSNVTDMSYTFYQSVGEPKGISGWNTSNVTNMSHLFGDAKLYTTDCVKDWNVSNVTDFSYAFTQSGSHVNGVNLTNATLNWNMKSAQNMTGMFQGCYKLTNIKFIPFTATATTNNMSNIFNNCSRLSDISELAKWDVSNVTNMSYAFSNTKIPNVNALSNWDVSNVTNMSYMFQGETLADISGLSNWQTSSLTDMSYMFYNQKYITDLSGISNFDVSHVTTMANTFYGLKNLSSLEPLSGWTTSSLTNLSNTFRYTYGLKSLKGLENWDVSHVTNMDSMHYCEVYDNPLLKDVTAISNWHATSLTNYSNMFYGNNLITEVDLSNWDLSGTRNNSGDAFAFCYSLIKISLPASFTTAYPSSYGTTYDTNKPIFNTNWIYTTDDSIVNLQDVMGNWSADKAGTYVKNYYLTLYPMGGTVEPTKIERNINQAVDELPTPTRDGYDFLGWYDSEGNLITSIAAGEYVATLFAQWQSRGTYTLIIDPNINGYEPYVVELKLDEKFRLDPTLLNIPDTFEFSHFTERKSGDGEVYNKNQVVVGLTELGETVTIYAQWITHDPIPVKVHFVNILTGAKSSNTIDVRLNEYLDTDQFRALAGKNRIQYASYRSDLDLVHYVENEEEINRSYSSSSITKFNQDGTDSGETYTFNYFYLKSEYAQAIDSGHKWTLEDLNKDIYVYYLPPLRTRIWFNSIQTNVLPVDLKMTINGHTYKSGEYILETGQSSTNDSFYYYGQYTTLYWGGNIYLPSVYASMVYQAYDTSIGKYIAQFLKANNATFNYPISLECVNWLGGRHKNFADDWQKLYGNQKTVYFTSPTDIMDISIPLDYLVVLDYGENYQTYGLPNHYYAQNTYAYETDKTVDGRLDKFKNLYGTTTLDKNNPYVIEGWYTAPNGQGRKVFDPNVRRTALMPYWDFTDCPVVSYTDKLSEVNNFNTNGRNANQNNEYITLYANYMLRSQYNQTVGAETQVKVIVHDSHYSGSTITHRDTLGSPIAIKDIYFDGAGYWKSTNYDGDISYSTFFTKSGAYFYEKDPIAFEDFIFGGWYTEPNGQGTEVTADTIIETTGEYHVYAYWKKPTEKINFSLETDGIHPNEVEIKFGNSAYSGYYTVTSTSAFILGAGKVEGYMIPYALTNESYNFVGWFDSNGHKLEVGDDFVDGTTYYAKWEDDIISIDGIDYNFMFVFSNGKTKMTLPNSYTEQLSYKLRFELNHTDNILNENAIKIYVPSDYLIDTSAIPRYYNMSDSQIYGYDSYGNLEYKFGIDKYYYTIANYKTINGSASVETIKRNLPINDSSYLRFKDSDGNYYSPRHDTTAKIYKSEYPVILVIDKDLDGTPEVVKYKYLYIESVPVAGSGISNYDNIAVHGEVSQNWNPDWGEEPVDAGDYIYVNWTLSNYGQRSDGTTDWSNVYSNQDMYFFANTKLPITCTGEKVLDHQDTYKGEDYEFSMSVLTKVGSPNTQEQHSENNSIIMRYPKSQFSYDAQMGEITQPFNILVAPRSAYANGDFYDDTVIKTGKVTWSWAEGSTTTNGRDFWANMGRFNYGFVSSANANNIKATQRQYAILDQKQEFDWYSLYAQRKINGSDSFSVSVKPGDFSYASGASDNCFMWQPTTGRTPLSTYDYCITGVKAVVYNGYSEKLNDGFDPNVPIYVGDIKDVDRNKNLDIYVMYRGTNTWTKLESDLDWSAPSNMGSYNDGHVNVSFNRGYSTYFNDEQWEYGEPGDGIYDTRIVGVKIGGQFETGSNYQVIIIVPTIRLFPNYTIQDKVKMDFNQDVKSAITQTDFTIDGYKSNASFRKGEWGSGVITDLGLTTWYLTSDVTDLDLNNRIAILNQNAGYIDNLQEGDTKVVFEVMNTAQNNTYYKPITSGDYYVLLPENTSFRFGEACFAGTSYANSGMFTTTAVNSSYYGDMNYASSGGLTPDECSVETIENWENSGRTMVIYHVKGLDEHYTQKYLSKVNGLFFIVYLHRENEDMYGIAGDIASLFIDKSGTFYVNRRTKYENTNEMVHEYFSNLNSQNAAKEKSMAYAYQDFEFYTIKYSNISGTENFAHQDGFNQYVANSSNKYTNNVSVFPGENYTYKVLWAQSGKKTIIDGSGQSQDIDNETNDTIIYTRLDGVGVFKEVSAPNVVGKIYLDDEHLTFENVTVTPTIWYCKDPNFASITDFEHYDLSTIVLDAEHGWYTSANLDSDAKVYGMAFDYSKDSQGRDVYLAGDKFIGITIYQQNLEKATQTFTSESRVQITNFNKSDYGGLNTVNVAIPDLKIDVVSNPASGTAMDPTAVRYEQDLVYTWTVHNREDRAINDVIVSFKVPDATTCTLDKIKVGVQSINESISIKDATLENGIVTLTIKTLSANSDFVITENTFVSAGENGIMIINQGFINGYNGIVPTDTQKDAYKSDITYHITLTMPEPTGIALDVLPYALIFGAICVTLIVTKKKLKRREE